MTNEPRIGASQAAKTALKTILGIVLLAVGVRLVWLWRWDVLTVIKGFVGTAIILAGVIFLAIAKE